MKRLTISTYSAAVALALCIPALMFAQRASGQSTTAVITNTIAHTDTDGNIMDVHDGNLEFFQGKFYLFGTRYGKTDGFGKTNRYVCYSSADLTHWQFHGDILKDAPEGVYYRPYVKYNPRTKKYVLWYNWYPTLWNGQYGVAVADTPAGPFVIQGTDDDSIVRSLLLAYSPRDYLGLRRTGVTFEPLGGEIWEGTAQYSKQEAQFTFDTGGGTQHISQSRGTVGIYAAPGEIAGVFLLS